jgi:hypothetical protein
MINQKNNFEEFSIQFWVYLLEENSDFFLGMKNRFSIKIISETISFNLLSSFPSILQNTTMPLREWMSVSISVSLDLQEIVLITTSADCDGLPESSSLSAVFSFEITEPDSLDVISLNSKVLLSELRLFTSFSKTLPSLHQ